ncbi:hypothetical protein [Streptomyces sp. NBRC 109706]|uniref:hypothetical protein n=1 Tax=Streptomyces sp. NBRC 109706 TaxID=1550035 RepID=UPI000785313C|nr:hypothetical protein [Streptomyces sp. NBRC 109706]
MNSRRLRAHLHIGRTPRPADPHPSPASTTHRYLTAAGTALGDRDHVVNVTDDQASDSEWSCAACPASRHHIWHENAHGQAQAHAAQCTALLNTTRPATGTEPTGHDLLLFACLIAGAIVALALVLTTS